MKTRYLLEIDGEGTPPDRIQYCSNDEGLKPVRYIREDFAQLQDFSNFNKRFDYYLPDSETYEEAYQKVEDEYKLAFGKPKYTNYDSFRQTRKAWMMRARVTTFHLR